MTRYLEGEMLRQLLTLLALVSGLGLVATPAVAAQANVVSVAASGDTSDCQVVSLPLELVRGKARDPQVRQPCRPRPLIVHTPTVQLQADRAHE
ncbi:hypothetical protein [Aurantiacibacter zhengii]|uniref:Uncharacterized protein n=1 Tax=Aurantiacibacter zhengii TaxID=2307003 RepID=A0A418NNE9_9SPHN|nr:hypothetical protein [Aurantiacibacter zhengii]RIV83362.1 hypothetical protein D2V07_16555 [Aurantiacibacter zhengii]